MKPWAIFATDQNFRSRLLARYSQRADAEAEALKLQKLIGPQLRVRALYVGGADHE
jgi:hypothetical protein